MHVHAHPVAGTVHIKLSIRARGQHVVHAAVLGFAQQAGVQHALRQHACGGIVWIGKTFAGFRDLDGRFLCRQNNVVQRALCRREFTVCREGAGDVAGVAVELATRINQAELATF